MERGEKRSLEGSEDDHQQQQHGKRPALAIENSSMSCHQQQYDVGKRPEFASVMVGALTVDTFQAMSRSSIRGVVREEVKSAGPAKLSGRVGDLTVDDFQEILQRVVREAMNSVMVNIGLAKLSERSSPKQIEGTASPKQIDETVGRNLQLYLRTRLSLPLFTGGKVEGEQGAAILVVLIDATNGHVVTSGPESSVKLDIVALDGDFNNEESDSWTQEEFESHVLKERDGKRPLLTGDLQVTLEEGVGTLGDLTFTDNSSWVRSKKFRLGLKVASGYCEGIRIREAKTEAFSVKDHRGELYKKHYPPALEDEVWRLKKIGKDGPFHLRLRDAGICNVEDFLRFVVTEPQKLRNILGSGMSNKMWDALIEHAKTCGLNGKLYVYYPVDSRGVGVIFNNIFEMSGFIDGEQYYSADSLSDTQKVFVDILVKKAYDNLNNLQEYGGESLLSFRQNQNSCMTRNEVQAGPSNYPNILDNQLQPAILPVPRPSEPSPVDPSMLISGSGPIDSMTTSYSAQLQLMNTTSSQAQFDSSSVAPHDQQITKSHHIQSIEYDGQMGVTIGAPPSSSSPQMVPFIQQPNVNPFGDLSLPLQMVTSVQQPNLNPFQDWSSSFQMVTSVQLPNLNPFGDSSSSFQMVTSVQQPDLNPSKSPIQEINVEDFLLSDEEIQREKVEEDLPSEEETRREKVAEEIQIGSHEMLENEDMQHLLQLFSMGGHASVNVPEDRNAFPSFMPSSSTNFTYEEDCRGSGKEVVSWLKIKAAMRWGFFIRRKAAERRAQIVELEDE